MKSEDEVAVGQELFWQRKIQRSDDFFAPGNDGIGFGADRVQSSGVIWMLVSQNHHFDVLPLDSGFFQGALDFAEPEAGPVSISAAILSLITR